MSSNVLILCKFDDCTNKILKTKKHIIFTDSLVDILMDHNICKSIKAIVLRSNVYLSKQVLEQFENLTHIIRAGSGLDNIDLNEVERRKIEIIKNPFISANAVGELALGHLINLTRKISLSQEFSREGLWNKTKIVGENILDLNICIWGAGPIGIGCYNFFRKLCTNLYFISHDSVSDILPQRSLDVACRESDVHIFCLPLRESTYGMINSEFINKVSSKTPYLINVARFDLFHFSQVMSALNKGILRGVSIDAIDQKHVDIINSELSLYSHLNFIVTQHVGAQREDILKKLGIWVLETLDLLNLGE
ncbi:hypothetical protein RW25_28435 [Bacillus sp. L_1B0_8]|uniref:NAD(P)-dependent oxidoreductase n=1 Tax=unclassified Bacillus (in: firmicutes) TaxID=185979 RepID=UPI0005B719A6|nr:MULTISPECIES: NAD(P)-dependent oxidoreductase [unclassified Bacillus (in: firmicutes)]KIQ77606.1 hypothetical protein RT27_30885 [Bacillus sp. L_1B0_5]KIQ78079.1 hypothetical protein RW25_28435 [Bacillus sp. L_1B0_8]